ncbi:unnamed protein product [Cladocopium goreaui]|uniref:RING finger protein 122 n=1 Tax=Cladocopium goreaui TaxID=2562237 RepID=A0A9P1CXZ1_9DINO|nr:unnamed protein product [Cladocopium goreaui]
MGGLLSKMRPSLLKQKSPNLTCQCWPWCTSRRRNQTWVHNRGFGASSTAIRRSGSGESRVLYTSSAPQWQEHRLPCGLMPSQVSELLDRDITPDDYEMLLQLDDALSRPTADKQSLEKSLQSVRAKEVLDQMCSVCLHPFERNDAVSALPCSHIFHEDCISRWLLERCTSCPLCNDCIKMS